MDIIVRVDDKTLPDLISTVARHWGWQATFGEDEKPNPESAEAFVARTLSMQLLGIYKGTLQDAAAETARAAVTVPADSVTGTTKADAVKL